MVETEGGLRRVSLSLVAHPASPASARLFLLMFEEAGQQPLPGGAVWRSVQASAISRLETELRGTGERVRALLEERPAGNEAPVAPAELVAARGQVGKTHDHEPATRTAES